MIGWYIHHHGAGHLHRARAVSAALGEPITVLSSVARPADWTGPWVALPRDDDPPVRPFATAWLHWAPTQHPGLRQRMALISAWLAEASPSALVCDVSVEVALLARLHGIPVVQVVMPGDRSDPAHRWCYDIASELVACWPTVAESAHGLTPQARDRLRPIGGLSRFAVAESRDRRPGPPRVVLLAGAGGSGLDASDLAGARRQSASWDWTVLHSVLGEWRDDPFGAMCDADVIVTHAGQNAVAEVAAARRPALVIPESRPHGEQEATARALEAGEWPVVVSPDWPRDGWSALLEEVASLDGGLWRSWCDGRAAQRFADVIHRAADHSARSA